MENSTVITIEDDLDLGKIAVSGQCFRVREFDGGIFRFIIGNNVIYMKRLCGDTDTSKASGESSSYEISCSEEIWHEVWEPYFDLARSYADIRRRSAGENQFVDTAMDFGCGIRVLKQDAWEMLVTFIISQRKNIPAISKSVDYIAERYGRPIVTEFETVHAFPTPEELSAANEEDLRGCSLGYRAPYVADAVRLVLSGELDLEAIAKLGDEELFEELQKVHGVGKKVANCICLFAYGRTGLVPVDVWIARAIEQECEGVDPFAAFGDDAGIIQQYVFFYMTQVAK